MPYTFQGLKDKLTAQISDPNLDDDVMGDAINYTQQDIFNTFDLTLNSAQQTNSVTSGTNTLTSALPTDYQRMSSLYITSPTALAADITEGYMAPKDFRRRFPAPTAFGGGQPVYWTYWTSLEFSCNANQTFTLVLDYIKSTPLLSASSDVPVIPEVFEELIILGAKTRIYEQKEDFDYAGQFTNRYADLLEAFTARYSTRQVDNQVVIPGARGRV